MNEYEIRAAYDSRSIIVYQAFGTAIALAALQNQHFVSPFSMNQPGSVFLTKRVG